ncbi:hypothetical protein [Paraflavitalea pollutisoli]|uniref:hypothetical protein n=1 Tax=Paraflavitalea pollutisoli TaxID=3034143 RepID=UPI0023EA9455|nr:hypothetical protein [Paraflavitalea sp. H1-2-19X]
MLLLTGNLGAVVCLILAALLLLSVAFHFVVLYVLHQVSSVDQWMKNSKATTPVLYRLSITALFALNTALVFLFAFLVLGD